MRRYWVDRENFREGDGDGETWVHLEGEVYHHIFDVCRRTAGDRFEVLASDGQSRLVEVVECSKKKALLKVLSSREIPPLPLPHIDLCVGLPRYPVMDKVVEKSVELGVFRIRPFVSDNSFIKKRENLPESKRTRWQRIIRSSTQQCGRASLMALEEIITLDQLLVDVSQCPDSQGLFFYEGRAQKSLKEALRQNKTSNLLSIWVFIGGEGGFSDREVEKFSRAGMESLTLDSHVLRVETACVALLSILKYELIT